MQYLYEGEYSPELPPEATNGTIYTPVPNRPKTDRWLQTLVPIPAHMRFTEKLLRLSFPLPTPPMQLVPQHLQVQSMQLHVRGLYLQGLHFPPLPQLNGEVEELLVRSKM